MLQSLKLKNVGPAATMNLDFGERINLLTGDNGLGKSFMLDIAWYCLTRHWPANINPKLTGGMMATPTVKEQSATIQFALTTNTRKSLKYVTAFNREDQAWVGKPGRPHNPGLVLYAMADGSFAVWDPARNYWKKKGNLDIQERQSAFVFASREIWDGLKDDSGKLLCRGLIEDWAVWQKENGPVFKLLKHLLKTLSPAKNEVITPGKLTRIAIDDARDIPTVQMPYGQDVPLLHASSGMRRIIALAYLLVWSWEEHRKASEILGTATASEIIFLVDELEAHLHPKWQRRIVSTLLDVIGLFDTNANLQIITATHSPLVMASVEPLFDGEKDAWFDFDLADNHTLSLNKREFMREGDISAWLQSEAFDLLKARSYEAEATLLEVDQVLESNALTKEKADELTIKLRRVLGETDPFWVRWRFEIEKTGLKP